jgi:CheY-like chemotaxis protein
LNKIFEISDFLRKQKSDSEIYHDLMQFRVREILLVTTAYDAFILEQEDQLTEKIFGEYYKLNLLTAPRITSVTTGTEALDSLKARHFDMVILTMRINEMSPFELSEKIKAVVPNIPVFLLLYDNNDINFVRKQGYKLTCIDKVFVWNRDSKIFLAMIKYIEDRLNVDNDTKVGLVRVILLVENSVRYYSKYLPQLYTEVIRQTQRIMQEERLDEMKMILRLNARPKVLMAVNYEEAVSLFEKYKEYLLCLISDVRFPKDGKTNEHAGLELAKYAKEQLQDLPVLLQSSDMSNAALAAELKGSFISKDSPNLSSELNDFIFNNLGFGDFVFRNLHGEEIARAKTLKQLQKLLRKVPGESLVYHASRNHFSAWLMARGEIRIAKKIQPVRVTDFPDELQLRNYLADVFEKVEADRLKGKVIAFDESLINEQGVILRLADGSLGGKGRGIAFLNSLLTAEEPATRDARAPSSERNEESVSSERSEGMDIRIPRTAIIGTQEFDQFMESNQLWEAVSKETNLEELKKYFLAGDLSKRVIKKLKVYLKHIKKPLAVRSSGLFEDSLSESFSGIYQTYLIPNNHPDADERLKQLMNAVKLVYASVYSESSRSYFEAIKYKVKEEKMAVVIQEVVGELHDGMLYPYISGVAESYNYYPVSHMKPPDGIAVIGVGLGKYIIDGENAYRFCPKYPKLEVSTPDIQFKNSQAEFYAIDMNRTQPRLSAGEDAALVRAQISEAEKHGTLEHCASVWDAANNRIVPDLSKPGPRIINFARILKYDEFPLADTLDMILRLVSNAMGSPVEIEFAVVPPPLRGAGSGGGALYILQIKPLIRETQFQILEEATDVSKDKLLLYTEKGMGNGVIEDISDIIYADPEKFDRSKTVNMTHELEKLNQRMRNDDRNYILIGPGRWGTRDRWLGIPVAWTQITNAKIIVETGMKDVQVDASLGSHFFHIITSMNIGYFYCDSTEFPPFEGGKGGVSFIDWSWLRSQKPENKTSHFIHLHFDKPLKIIMDGRKGISAIYKAL